MRRLNILWRKLLAKTRSSIVNVFAKQTNFDIKNTVLIVGTTRSGTTFLMESLNSINEYRIIFEPFNSFYTKEWKSFGNRCYIDPENCSKDENRAVETILSGRIKNTWVDQYNKKIISEKRLIKAVRANLLLDYLPAVFPELTIIYVYRDPYDVVASRINLNFDPLDGSSILNDSLDFVEKYYSDIDFDHLTNEDITNRAMGHALLWCLENRYILNSLEQRNLIVCKYEDIIGKTILLKDKLLSINSNPRPYSVTSSIHTSYTLTTNERENVSKILAFFQMDEFIK